MGDMGWAGSRFGAGSLVRIIVAAAAVVVLTAACTSAAPADEATSSVAAPTTTDEVDVTSEITVHRIAYPTRTPGDPDQNWGDFYLPAGPQAPDSIPLVVLIHGGSWKSQLDAKTMEPYAINLAERGMAVYNIEYRRVGSGGGWPTTFTDVADALDHVIAINEQYPQITVDDELVVGHSAGAQLAAWAGTRDDLNADEVGSLPKFRPTRVISLAGPLDMVYAAEHGNDRIVTVLGGTPDEVPTHYASVDPIQNIDPTMPIIAIHGDQDTMVPMILSERYIDQVEAVDGVGDLVIAEGENHVSIVDPDSAAYPMILNIITDTSNKTLDELAASYGS